VKKTLNQLARKKRAPKRVPTKMQRIRKYVLQNGECTTQQGVVEGYVGGSNHRFRIRNSLDDQCSETAEIPLMEMQGVLELSNGITEDEMNIIDTLGTVHFPAEEHSQVPEIEAMYKAKRQKENKYGHKIRTPGFTQPFCKAYSAGITKVVRDSNRKCTTVTLLYEDEEQEEVPFEECVEMYVEKQDPNRKERLRENRYHCCVSNSRAPEGIQPLYIMKKRRQQTKKRKRTAPRRNSGGIQHDVDERACTQQTAGTDCEKGPWSGPLLFQPHGRGDSSNVPPEEGARGRASPGLPAGRTGVG